MCRSLFLTPKNVPFGIGRVLQEGVGFRRRGIVENQMENGN